MISNINNPYQIQNPYMPQSQTQARTNGIVWVQGIEGAKAYQVPANSNAIMMDSEIDGRFYIKTCDEVGMSKLRLFKFEEIVDYTPNTNTNLDLSEYVKKDELQTLLTNILKSQEVIKNEQPVQTTKSKQPNK